MNILDANFIASIVRTVSLKLDKASGSETFRGSSTCDIRDMNKKKLLSIIIKDFSKRRRWNFDSGLNFSRGRRGRKGAG